MFSCPAEKTDIKKNEIAENMGIQSFIAISSVCFSLFFFSCLILCNPFCPSLVDDPITFSLTHPVVFFILLLFFFFFSSFFCVAFHVKDEVFIDEEIGVKSNLLLLLLFSFYKSFNLIISSADRTVHEHL